MAKPNPSHNITELHAEIGDLRAMLSRTIPILQATAAGHETRMASGDLLNSIHAYFQAIALDTLPIVTKEEGLAMRTGKATPST